MSQVGSGQIPAALALESAVGAEASGEDSQTSGDAGGSVVDLDALADRLLILLKRELVIERERMGRWRSP